MWLYDLMMTMHKCVILLTKADTAKQAIHNTVDFLEPYGNGKIWDFYVIGGRWSGLLAGLESNEGRDTYKDNPEEDDVMLLSRCVDYIKEYTKKRDGETGDAEQEDEEMPERRFAEVAWDSTVYNIQNDKPNDIPVDTH